MNRAAALALGAVLFALLSTANSGGYRFGVSDQAFYIPAVAISQDASRFPHDRALIAPQLRLWAGADVITWPASLDGGRLPRTFFALYLLTLGLLFAAAVALARALGASTVATAIFVLLLTLRHRIPRTGANSLEGYMHPRMLAFAIGLFALAWIARARYGRATLAAVMAAFVHPTTGGWFLIVLTLAFTWRHRARRWVLITATAVAGVVVFASIAVLMGHWLVRMDDAWTRVFEDRDYLLASEWPWSAWLLNLAYPVAIAVIYRARVRSGRVVGGEADLVAGLIGLVGIFVFSVPFTALKVALAVQLQVNRVFWLLDAAAALYVAWWLADVSSRRSVRLAYAVAGLFAVCAMARGAYLLHTQQRPLVAIDLPVSDWTDAMQWLAARPERWQVVADPNHVYRYGPSVRIAARQDVLLDASKDPALAIYDRTAAMRVADRQVALDHFDDLSTADIRLVARTYDGDVLVDRHDHLRDLPVLYSNNGFVIYDLK